MTHAYLIFGGTYAIFKCVEMGLLVSDFAIVMALLFLALSIYIRFASERYFFYGK